MPGKLMPSNHFGMKSVFTDAYIAVSTVVPTPHRISSTRVSRHGAKNVLRWSSRVGGRSSMAQRTLWITRRVAQNTPMTTAATTYIGTAMNVIHRTDGSNTLGVGKATVTT